MKSNSKPVLVIGGGISGMTAAVEAAEVGYSTILVEKEPYIGGRVMRTHRYFPKMCPPTCGFEINLRRIRRNPRIKVHTLSTVAELTGTAGNFKAKILKKPRHVTGRVSLDESVVDQISSERSDEFNLGMGTTKALYRPHAMAYPHHFVLDKEALSEADAATLMEVCPEGSLDLEMQAEEFEVEAGAVILATGWRPYDATKLEHLGYGRCRNVITNVMMERLAARDGPTGGEIVRPSDGKKAVNVAFVQCAGSRDEDHLPYCSSVCCMASMKQARYLRESDESAKASIFYIDIRAIGRHEKFYYNLLEDSGVAFFKGKVAEINEDPQTQDLVLTVEDTLLAQKPDRQFDLVVLATGVVPNTVDTKIPFEVAYDEYGFIDGTMTAEGVYAVGCAKRPCDVSRAAKDSTAAALKAIQCLRQGE